MPTTEPFERYPAWMVTLSVLHSVSIYALGAYLMAELGTLALAIYVVFLVWVELGILRKSCVSCFYYGKLCGLGRGALAAWLFKPGQPRRFAERKVTWHDVVPDLAAALVPLTIGLVFSITRFSWPRLTALVALALLWFVGTALVRGQIACAHCAQKALGCPAQKLFERGQV